MSNSAIVDCSHGSYSDFHCFCLPFMEFFMDSNSRFCIFFFLLLRMLIPGSFASKSRPSILKLPSNFRAIAQAAQRADSKGIEIPRQWYNQIADLPVKPPPSLHPLQYSRCSILRGSVGISQFQITHSSSFSMLLPSPAHLLPDPSKAHVQHMLFSRFTSTCSSPSSLF